MRPPGQAHGGDQEKAAPVLVLRVLPGTRGLSAALPLVAHRYPQSRPVRRTARPARAPERIGAWSRGPLVRLDLAQLAEDVPTARVHKGVGDEFGDDQDRRLARLLGCRPAVELRAGEPPGLGGGARVSGEFETRTALTGLGGD
ncbi:putative regulatory protein [Streptomyces sp. Tu6071]|nr:putative regulatory protein [Streptomyces sp. Tu6071]